MIDVVCSLVPAVKLQAAFFEELGPAGMAAMAEVIAHAQDAGLLVIVDGKRNDIGSTALAYARGYLGRAKVPGMPMHSPLARISATIVLRRSSTSRCSANVECLCW